MALPGNINIVGGALGAWGNLGIGTAEFKVTPDELRRQSTAVSSTVSSVRNKFSGLERTISSTTSFWKGDASDAFRSVYADFKDEIEEIINRLSEHVVDLEKMAGVYDQAEAKANEIIESLPSDVLI